MNWLPNLLNTEWFLGFLSGVAATILGFVLTIIWDTRKARSEAQARDETVLSAINEELRSNRKSLEQNLLRLRQELTALGENKSLVSPLFTMKTGFWDVAKLNLPKKLFVGSGLARLRHLVFLAEQVNDEVSSRENYRIHNVAMSNNSHRMKACDESLVRVLQAPAQRVEA